MNKTKFTHKHAFLRITGSLILLFTAGVFSLQAQSAIAKSPAQTTNMALNRPVTCSSIENTGTACANAVDGNASTRWSSAFSDPQWIRVDLGSTQPISRVRLTWEAAYGRSYQIQTSNDATNWTTIYST